MQLSCFRALHHHLCFNCHLPGKSGFASFPWYTSFTCSGREHFGVSVMSFLCAYVPSKALKEIQNTDFLLKKHYLAFPSTTGLLREGVLLSLCWLPGTITQLFCLTAELKRCGAHLIYV